MKPFFDAFISYGRADSKAFATKLYERLLAQGLNIWFDQNDIPLGVDFQEQIYDGIEKADNFLFIIAPHSVKSIYCLKEIVHALKCNKRIIPLLHVEPSDCWDKLHPTIGKINWVYFREEQDDFEKAFAGLVDLIGRHRDYVEQHTQFLVKALDWERQQKQTSYLLIGEERQQAEAWLKIRFKDEQPPCLPTDLHGEFITESIKNATNLMTQVFLSYAEEDRALMEKIRNSLRRESITVWTNKGDIQTGEAFVEAINRGIEQADSLVFLISPDSINSDYCQQELNYALSLHKRIIPLLVRETNPIQVPGTLRELHYIDLTDNVEEEDYRLDESQLLRILRQDEAYYNEHKVLLVKALKWKQQHGNPSILLRGFNLRHAQDWLKTGQQRTQHPPTPLQEEFINESLRQPPAESLDVFVSYSRADSDFARKLNDALQIQNKMTWFDQESIASGSDFQQEIYRGIKACDNFLFILSPRSVNSPYCADEVEYAAKLNKRFVTVLHQQVNPNELHPELAKVQWIDFSQDERNFNANLNQLMRTLDTDREHLRSHTRWLQRAIEWEQKGKSTDLLLRGNEFAVAQSWLQETEQQKKQPAAAPLQTEFILESGKAIEAELKKEKQRATKLKSLLGLATAGLLVSLCFAGVAFRQYQKSLAGEIESLGASSEARFALGEHFEALLTGLRAAKKLQTARLWAADNPQLEATVVTALQQSISQVREKNRLEGHQGAINNLGFSPDGKTIATVSDDKTAKLWSLNGKQLHTLEGHSQPIYDLEFSPDGKLIATGSYDKTAKLWRNDSTLIVTLKGHQGGVYDVEFSPNGKMIATASEDKTVKLWRLDGTLIVTLKGHERGILDVKISPDGKTIATASWDATVRLWDMKGKLLHNLKGHTDWVRSVSFSPDGKRIATASDDKTVKIWDSKKGITQRTLRGHRFYVVHVSFSPDGKTIATASLDKTARLWSWDGKERRTLEGHTEAVSRVGFSPDGKTIATASEDKTVKLWRLDGTLLATLSGHNNAVSDVRFSRDGYTIASASLDRTVKLWNRDNTLMTTLMRAVSNNQSLGNNASSDPTPISFSPKGQAFATTTKEGSVQLWQADGTPLATPVKTSKAFGMIFSPNGETLVTMHGDGSTGWIPSADATGSNSLYGYGSSLSVKRWKANGTVLATLIEKIEGDVRVSFSPDSQTFATIGNGSIKLWKANGTKLATLPEKIEGDVGVSFSPDSRTFATIGNGSIKFWKANGKKLATLIGKSEGEVKASFSPDSRALVTWNTTDASYGPIKLWRTDGTPVATLIEKSESQRTKSEESQDYEDWDFEPVEVSFSADGQTLATAINDGKSSGLIKLWQANGTPITTLAEQSEGLVDVKFSEKGQTLVTRRKNGPMKVWRANGSLIATLSENSSKDIGQVIPSPDGQIFVTVNDNAATLWNDDGTIIATLQEKGHGFVNIGIGGGGATVEFSPDSKTIALVSQETVTLWNRDGTFIDQLDHNADVNKVNFSPNSQIFSSASADKTVKLWNRNSKLTTTFTGYTAGIEELHFSPDNKFLLSATKKEIVIRRLGDLTNLNKLLARGCELVANYIQNSPNVENSDRTLCDGINPQKQQ